MDADALRVLLVADQGRCSDVEALLREVHVPCEVFCAARFDDAVKSIQSCGHDIALLDARIGVRTALDVLHAVSPDCDAPVIVLADEEDFEIDVAAARAGAADYLVKKHVNAPLLERAMRYAIERKRVERAWKKALSENNRLSASIQSLSTGVLLADSRQNDNPLVFVNAAFTQITQYSRQEAIGRNCRFLQGPKTDAASLRAIREAINAGKSYHGEVLNYRKDGTPFWNELSISPIWENGKLVNFVGLMNDVSARRQDAERLRESQAQLAEAQRIAHLGSWHWDVESDAVIWSDELFRIYGREHEEKLSWKKIRAWIHPDDRRALAAQVRKSCADLSPHENYHRIVRPDGDMRVIHSRGEVARTVEGKVLALSGTSQDVTELANAQAELQRAHDELEARVFERTRELEARTEALRASEERARTIIESARDAYIAIDMNGVILEWNPRAETMFGWSREEAIGARLHDLITPPQYKEVHLDAVRTFIEAGNDPRLNQRIEASALDKSGREFPVEMTISLLRWGGRHVLSFFLHDISARKQDEERLRAAIEDAQHQRERAEQERERAERERQSAERANRAKSEFLSRMSHELRTPLNSILGFGQLLQRDELTAKQRERLDLIVAGGHHLLALINEVLDLSRVEAGRLSLSIEATRVSEIVAESIALVRPLAARRGIEIENQIENHIENQTENEPLEEEALLVLADGQRLKQILLNLLSNALKYNQGGGRVRVWHESTPDKRVAIHVSNTGAGIASEDLPRLFQPFERLHASTEIEGTGLGLALCKRLAEAMDGAMRAQSTPGAETTFSCELPRAHAPTAAVLDAQSTQLPAFDGALRVLCIEDNLVNLKLLQSLFADLGSVQLLTAMQGEMGIELAREHAPDLILLDVHLPDLDGSEVLRRLQADERTREIPVVMLSADATPRQVERLLKNGARGYLTKPLDVEELLRVLRGDTGNLRARRTDIPSSATS